MKYNRPIALDAERGILAAVMLNPGLLSDVLSMIQPEQMSRPAHEELLRLMVARRRENQDISLIGLVNAITTMGCQDRFGGLSYVMSLDCPSTQALGAYLRTVREYAGRRDMMDAAEQMLEQASRLGDPSKAVAAAGEAMLSMSAKRRKAKTIGAIYREVIEDLSSEAKGESQSVQASGWGSVDHYTGGLRFPEFTVIAARPSMGKTAMVMNLALNLAEEQGVPVGILSLEMNNKNLIRRCVATLTRVSADKVMSPRQLTQDDWNDIVDRAEDVDAIPLHVDDTNSARPAEIVSIMRRWASQGVRLVVIDHLGEVKHDDHGNQSVSVGETAGAIKRAAYDLDQHVVLLQQLNRSCETRQNKRPMKSDLRDSGRVEELADNIIFVYRDHYYDETANPLAMELIVAKSRMGRMGTAHMNWHGCLQLVTEETELSEVI